MAARTPEEKYKKAVQALVANCGPAAAEILSTDPARFTDEKVRALAGTSPEYQQHVIGRTGAGDTNPFRIIAATLLVYDTVRFGEVTSRLHRAVGMVRKEAAYLSRAVEQDAAPDRLADRLLTLDLVAEQASRLRDLLTELEAVEGAGSAPTRGGKADTALIDKRHAAGGLGLIAKNVRNVATLQPAHRPTPRENDVALRLTTEAIDLAVTARDAAREAFACRRGMSCAAGPYADEACDHPRRGRRRRGRGGVAGRAVSIRGRGCRGAVRAARAGTRGIPRRRRLVDVGNTHDPESVSRSKPGC